MRYIAAIAAAFLCAPNVGNADQNLTTSCGTAPPLDSTAQFHLSMVDRQFLVFFRQGETPMTFEMDVKTPRAFMGDAFPEDVCGADVTLRFADGIRAMGVLRHSAPDPKAEHRDYAYRVTIKGQPKAELRFSATPHGVIWGTINMPAAQGAFVGNNRWAWQD